jgi:hypothetical protein
MGAGDIDFHHIGLARMLTLCSRIPPGLEIVKDYEINLMSLL